VVVIAVVCVLAIVGIALVRRFWPHGTLGLTLLAIGHATGAPRTGNSLTIGPARQASTELSTSTAAAMGARA
jgi:predicted cobalt transporter CbtA